MRVHDDINIIGKIKELMKLDSKLKDTNVVKNPYLERRVNTFQDPHSIDPLLSHHCWAMQNSKYLIIDCNTRTTLKQYRYMQRSILSQNGSEYLLKQLNNFGLGTINLRYCNEKEVHRRNLMFLRFKCTFLAKLQRMNVNSKSVIIQQYINEWIQENIEYLFDVVRKQPSFLEWANEVLGQKSKDQKLKDD